MHSLSRFLLDNENPTIAQLIAHPADDVDPKEAANVIQFCFAQLISDRQELTPEQLQNIFNKLFNFLLENEAAFTNSTHIATVFNVFGEMTDGNERIASLLQQHQTLLIKFISRFTADEKNWKEKAFATFFQGLGQLKDNNVLTSHSWQSENFQSMLLDVLERITKISPLSAKAIAIVIFGLSRLQITTWSESHKQRLDNILLTLINSFLRCEKFSSTKPNAQEISNLVYALAKLAKHGALIPTMWLETKRKEETLYIVIRLIYKKKPEELAISQIFYALGKLAEEKCLEQASIFWLIKPIIQYLFPQQPDYRTINVIFVALGRLAERGHILATDKDKEGYGTKELLNKLLDHANFAKSNDIGDFFLSLGRLAQAGILTEDIWQQHATKFIMLINQFQSNSQVDPLYKRAFLAGMQKLKQQGFKVSTPEEAEQFDRSPSVSPILDARSLTRLRTLDDPVGLVYRPVIAKK
jgi:hypothetical protein